MPGLHNLNQAAVHPMAIRRNDQACQRMGPMILDDFRHCRGTFARANDHRAPARGFARQLRRQAALGADGIDCAFVQLKQNSRSEEPTSELQSLMRLSYDAFCW